jgi:phosphoribosylanthranilate isomerase
LKTVQGPADYRDKAEILQGKVQIAGVIDDREAQMLVESGADFLGFPLRLLDGREDLSESAAKSLISRLQIQSTSVVITYSDSPDEIIHLCDDLGVEWVQLHGPIDEQKLSVLRRTNPALSVIKSLIIRDNNLDELRRDVEKYSPYVTAFITDTHDPATGRTGATGKTHDWTISRSLVECSDRPVIVAGGLSPMNVMSAILATRPAAVDAHSALEGPDGRKDPDKVRKFIEQARLAFEKIH